MLLKTRMCVGVMHTRNKILGKGELGCCVGDMADMLLFKNKGSEEGYAIFKNGRRRDGVDEYDHSKNKQKYI